MPKILMKHKRSAQLLLDIAGTQTWFVKIVYLELELFK